MRTERQAPIAEERLAPEELDAIRRRFADADGSLPRFRADGAAGLEDVAEALGVSTAEVRRELDAIREDRSLNPVAPKRDQRPLLALAVVLLAAAFVLHRLNPRALSAEEQLAAAEERLTDIRSRMRAHPKVHYPIETRIRSGALPPAGFHIEFDGELTKTAVAPAAALPVDEATARAALAAAFVNAYHAAARAEANAPKPSTPLPKKERFYGQQVPPGALAYTINGGGSSTLSYIDPGALAAMTPEARERAIAFQAENLAKGVVAGVAAAQKRSLEIEKIPPGGFPTLPPGFSVAFSGRQPVQIQSTDLSLLPLDEARVAEKIEWAIDRLLWHDLVPPDYATAQMRTALAKTPTPAFANVTLKGPAGERRFKLPLVASPGYPTAGDAARAAQRIVADEARRAAAGIGALNRRVGS